MTLFDQKLEIVLPEHNKNGNERAWQENKPHFKNQTQIVLEHLLRGETVTGKLMYDLHGIQDVRPRIAAIKKSLMGTQHYLTENRIKGANGAKEWKLESKANSLLENSSFFK